jgi:hypothetical protein
VFVGLHEMCMKEEVSLLHVILARATSFADHISRLDYSACAEVVMLF